MHEGALEEMRALENQGRVILLSAPRAGHGKTHLLGRVAERLQGEAVVASLPWQTEDGMTWSGCGRGIIADMAYSGLAPNTLQRVCSGIHAALLKRLIQTGRIPSTDPTQALRVLSQDPMNLFSDSGPARVIGEWFRKHYDQLHTSLTEATHLEGRAEVGDLLRAMFEYVEQPSAASLSALAAGMDVPGPEQLTRFLKLAAIWKPVILVADHMDGLYRDAEAGVAVARMALVLTSLPGVRVVLSMNQDLWDTTFGRQLPSALEDRLNARNVSLSGLNAAEARELVDLRMVMAGVGETHREDFLGYLDLDRYFLGRAAGSISSRGMLRHAAQSWRKWLRTSATEVVAPGELGPADGDALPLILEEEEEAEEGANLPEANEVPAPPFLPDLEEEPEEDMTLLAQHLAQDQGGEVISLAGVKSSPFLPTAPAPPVVPSHAERDESSPKSLAKESGASPFSIADFSPPAPAAEENVPAEPATESSPPPSDDLSVESSAVPGPAQETPSEPVADEVPPASAAPDPNPAKEAGESAFKPAPPETGDKNFDKLRQLLSRVRATQEGTSLPEASAKGGPKVRVAPAPSSESPPKVRLTASALPMGVSAGQGTTGLVQSVISSGMPVVQRYEELRRQILGKDQLLKVNWPFLTHVVRLAGRRFQVVNYDEVDLPGLVGRSLPRWRLQGMEMVFGLEEFADEHYWKTVTSFVVGRVAELTAAAVQNGQPAPQIKLLVFKGDHEAASLAGLLQQEVIPSALRTHLDVVHLDNRSLASIYGISQLIGEMEHGAHDGEQHTVLNLLANELDFFWKRVTRPLR
jgi:hypothetical protein